MATSVSVLTGQLFTGSGVAPDVAPLLIPMSNDNVGHRRTIKNPLTLVGCGFLVLNHPTWIESWRRRRDSYYDRNRLRRKALMDRCKFVAPKVAPRANYLEVMVDAKKGIKMKWKPIETAPKDGTIVDLWHKDGFRIAETWWDSSDECWSICHDDDFTHWMPMPDPPSSQK